ncbi:MAG TPA: carboxypeptidase regulatory-like domain-containing protein [Kofleriaceae bacterium]|jgi:protocatechuate 3,4-dioxygenase beta subunit
MGRKLIGVAVVVVAVLALWWRHHQHHLATPAADHAHAAGSQLPQLHAARPPAKPASLSGRVTRKTDGSGIAGAVVSLGRADLGGMIGMGGPTPIAVTDPTGAWTLAAVPPAMYVVSATANGFMPASAPRVTLASGEQRAGITIALEAGGTLVHGTVTDIGGGPVAGVHIQLRPDSARMLEGGVLVALSGADGKYQIAVRDGPYSITAKHDDYADKEKSVLVAGKPLQVDFKLTPGSTIHGIVIARDTNKPVPNAMIMATHSSSERMGEPVATSGDDGTFTLTGREPGVTAITAKAPGYATTSPTTVRLGIGEAADGVRVLVDHAFSISGRVVTKGDKHAIGGVVVGAFTGAGDAGMSPDPTGSDGAFEVFGLKPGSYIMFAIGQDSVPGLGKTVPIVDKDVTGVEIELDRGITLSGIVEPPGESTVSLALAGDVGLANIMDAAKAAMVHADADATGAWKLEHVPAGRFNITARTTTGPTGSLPVTVTTADQSGLVVKLEPKASIGGHILDTDNNAVAGVKVRARPGEHEKPEFSMNGDSNGTTTSGPDGAFTIVGLDAGTYKLSVGGWQDLDSMEGSAADVTVADGAAKTGVVLTIKAKNGVISGQVLDGNHQPTGDAWVTARQTRGKSDDADNDWWAPTTEPVLTGEDGKFAVRGLTKGSYTVIVDGPKGSSRAEQKSVNTGDNITITLAALGTLNGHVTSNGSAVTAFDLSCRGPTGPVDHTFATNDGSYTLDHLAPGSYNCNVDSDGGAGSGSVEVPSDSATLDFAVAAWGQLSGTVVSAFDGSPVPGLSAIPGDDEGKRMTEIIAGGGPQTDANGAFSIGKIKPGTNRLMIFSATSSMTPLATTPYTVSAGQHLDLGQIKVVPPRQGDAGTFGMAVADQNGSVVVTSIKPGGAADAAGLVVGDMILTINGQAVAQLGVDPSVSFLSSGTVGIGVSVQLGLARGGSVTLTSVKW